MPQPHAFERVINHRRMRQLVGYIAFLLPPVVVLLSGKKGLDSISISYWTDSQDIFVGALFAVGFFLAAYNGRGKCGRLEKGLSRAACLFAILVALFPTTGFDPKDVPHAWVSFLARIVGQEPPVIHYFSAVLLFVCLFLMLVVFSFRASRKGKPLRSLMYLFFSLGMLLGLPTLYIILECIFHRSDTIFWVEWAGLWLFGFGWFLAGTYKVEHITIPPGAKELTSQPIEVDPRNKNFPTQILACAGREYLFVAEGCWKDWFVHCGPDGWGPKWGLFARRNRVAGEPVFALCGNIGKSEDDAHNFCVGGFGSWCAPQQLSGSQDQEIYLYANDWPDKYENNRALDKRCGGPMAVRIFEL